MRPGVKRSFLFTFVEGSRLPAKLMTLPSASAALRATIHCIIFACIVSMLACSYTASQSLDVDSQCYI